MPEPNTHVGAHRRKQYQSDSWLGWLSVCPPKHGLASLFQLPLTTDACRDQNSKPRNLRYGAETPAYLDDIGARS